jgi:radical SAM superfamily enzyme YgiQ (UPF0313 family)
VVAQVVLINPSYVVPPFDLAELQDDPHFIGLPSDEFLYPPVGLLTIGGALKRAGFDVELIDCNTQLMSAEDLAKRCEGAQVVGISLLVANLRSTYRLAQAMRGRGYEVVVGGAHPTVDPSVVASLGLRYGITGEGEVAFTQLCAALIRGEGTPEDIAGIVIAEEGRVLHSLPPVTLPDPSNWGLDRSLVPPRGYKLPFAGHTEVALSSRGCPYTCTFCYCSSASPNQMFNTMRWVDVDVMVRDMMDTARRYKPNYIEMVDETFTVSRKYVLELCEALIEAGFDVPWGAKTRIDLVDDELLDALQRAGMRKIGFGLESGVYDHRKAMRKDFTDAKAEAVFREAHRLGIETACTVIFGHPDETRADMQTSVDMVKHLHADYVEFHLMVLIPGTVLFDQALAEGKVQADVFDRFMRGEADYPEYAPGDMTPQQMREVHKAAVREFYFRPAYIAQALKRLRHRPSDVVQYAKTARSLLKRSKPAKPVWAVGRSRI